MMVQSPAPRRPPSLIHHSDSFTSTNSAGSPRTDWSLQEDLPPSIDSSSSSAHNKGYMYDVFLSFRGEDTRKNFVDHLYAALDQHGIRTFKDDERLEKGKRISGELLQSIEDSRLYIVVFSKHYASSSWCLNELLKIMECYRTNAQTVIPVFYDVDPTEVRNQTGSVGEALEENMKKNASEVEEWRQALKEAADLSGWDVRNTADGHEAKVIREIIQQISRPVDIDIDENLIGLEKRMLDLDPCLEIGTNDVRMIGIKGMGGSGKTTLARAIFGRLSINFEGESFVENVRENASKFGLKKLQEKILRDVLKDNNITVSDAHEGKNLMRKYLCGKKVLVVLDDVDHKHQLEMLTGDTSWFKPGSRIIITTRDGQALEAHGVKFIHDVNLLSEEEAICLFSRHAFGRNIPTQDFKKHLRKVVTYADGLPFTIKGLASVLCGKDNGEWRYQLERLITLPPKETLKILEPSYENLEDDCKEMFLDVACFLRGWKKEDAISMLESCGFYAKYGLRVLEQKSLIVTSQERHGAILGMHDHLVEMGKKIVRSKHPNEPNKHSRLWDQDEIERVLADNSGTEATRCIDLKTTRGICMEGLRNMKKLRCLIVNQGNLESSHNHVSHSWYFYSWSSKAHMCFPDSLQYVYWKLYPHWCLPQTFEANNLVALEMPSSEIEQLWQEGKVMANLKFLNLSYSEKLRSLDLRLTPNLEKLNLQDCENLISLCVQGGCLKSLVNLNLNFCNRLVSISFIEQLESLEVLDIRGLDLKEFPEYIITAHSIDSLLELNLSNNKDIEEVPLSIGNLNQLVSLDLSYCSRLKSLPGSICNLQQLKTLYLSWTPIEELPENLGQLECLEELYLSDTNVKHLPCSICKLKHLKSVDLSNCDLLEKLPEDVGRLESLEILELKDCGNLREIPNSICKIKCLKDLNFLGCRRLQKLPEEIGNLKCLQLLDIQDTGIAHLPHSIYLLKGLKILK